jgi:dihydropteroate synthase
MNGHSHPVTYWQVRQQRIEFGAIPILMGIVNVTPDSFSDGGKWHDTSRAVEHALQLVEDGAGIIDIGGESTRPYSQPVSSAVQCERVIPVIEAVSARTARPISIDTASAEVAAAAIGAGAQIVNDVTGLTGDPAMLDLVRDTGVGVCVMHMQGTPQTMQDRPTYNDCVAEIHDFLLGRFNSLVAAGIEPHRICLDPGIGFGKTHEHNWELVHGAARFCSLPAPILVGHSRKGFIGQALGDKDRNRDAGTLGISLWLADAGIHVLRVHEVRNMRDALITHHRARGS